MKRILGLLSLDASTIKTESQKLVDAEITFNIEVRKL